MSTQPKLPAGIMRWKGGRYRVRISYEGRQRSVGYFDTLQDAKAALAIAKADAARGIFIPPAEKRRAAREAAKRDSARSLTFREWLNAWLEQIQATRTIGTYREYRSTLYASPISRWDDRRLAEITPKDILNFLNDASAQKGAAYRNKLLRIMRSMFNAALEQGAGGLEKSPVQAKEVKTASPERRVISPAQVKELAEAMPEEFSLSVYLAAWCALRQGEVLGLQRRDFSGLDSASPTLRVERQWNQKTSPPSYTPTKGKDARDVSIPATLIPLIIDHLDRHVTRKMISPIFESTAIPGQPLSQTRHNVAWKNAREAAGLPHLRFHDLRHTGLTFYAQQGATVKEIMERGGHKTVEVALRYQHAASERARALADALPVQV